MSEEEKCVTPCVLQVRYITSKFELKTTYQLLYITLYINIIKDLRRIRFACNLSTKHNSL